MALATETDPVETLRLILDPDESHTAAGDYSNLGAAPDHVERLNATDRETKKNRATNAGANALYLWSPDVGNFSQFDAEWDYEATKVVQVEAWAPIDDDAKALAKDVVDILFASWVRDNKASTAWNQIAPLNEDDLRASSPAEPSNRVFEVDVQVGLGRLAEP